MIKYDLMKTKSQSDPKPHTEQIFPVPVPWQQQGNCRTGNQPGE